MGGPGEDSSCSFLVQGNLVTLCGYTESRAPDFPVTDDAFQPQNAGASDVFVTMLDLSQEGEDQFVYSTFIGGNAIESGFEEWPANTLKESTSRIALSPDVDDGGSLELTDAVALKRLRRLKMPAGRRDAGAPS